MANKKPISAGRDFVHVDAGEDKDVLFTPENLDRFMCSSRQAVQAVQYGLGARALIDEWTELAKHVVEWIKPRSERLRSAYLTCREGRFAIFVVPKSDVYDLDLTDSLALLDMELAEKFQHCPSEVVQVPGESPEVLSFFVDETKALRLYGPREQAAAT